MDIRYPKVGVGVIVRRGDELLLQRRTGAHGAGTWALPGGHLEWNESLEDCAVREVREEVGLDVIGVRFVGITNDRMLDEDRHYLTVFVEAEWHGEPKVLESHRSAELGWFRVGNLPDPLFEPLRALVAGEAYGASHVYGGMATIGRPNG